MPQNTLKMMYYALIYPPLLHGLSISGSTYTSYLKNM